MFTLSNPLGDIETKWEDKDNPLIEIKDKVNYHVQEEIVLFALDVGLVFDKTNKDVRIYDHALELINSNSILH